MATNTTQFVTLATVKTAFLEATKRSDQHDISTIALAVLLYEAKDGGPDWEITNDVLNMISPTPGNKERSKYAVGTNAVAAFLAGKRTALFKIMDTPKERMSTLTQAGTIAGNIGRAIDAGMAKIAKDNVLLVQWKALTAPTNRKASDAAFQSVADTWVVLGDNKTKANRTRTWNVVKVSEKGETTYPPITARNFLSSFKQVWAAPRSAQATSNNKSTLQKGAEAVMDVIAAANENGTKIAVKPDKSDDMLGGMLHAIAANDQLFAILSGIRRTVEEHRKDMDKRREEKRTARRLNPSKPKTVIKAADKEATAA